MQSKGSIHFIANLLRIFLHHITVVSRKTSSNYARGRIPTIEALRGILHV